MMQTKSKQLVEKLQKDVHEVSAELYKQDPAAAQQEAGDQAGGQADPSATDDKKDEKKAKDDDTVVDADYTEVEDKK